MICSPQLVALVTLNAKTPLTTAPEKIAEHGPTIGVMTGNAVNGTSVSGIECLIAGGVGEVAVQTVTVDTNVLRTALEHCGRVRAMEFVAIGTTIPAAMFMEHLLTGIKGRLMTRAAPPAFVRGEQRRLVPDVRVMTEDTIVGSPGSEMGVGLIEGCAGLPVAGKTECGTLLFAVTGITISLGKGSVRNLPEQT